MSEILSADPVTGADGVVRLGKKTSGLFNQILLRGIELLAIDELQVPFRGDDVRAGAALRVG